MSLDCDYTEGLQYPWQVFTVDTESRKVIGCGKDITDAWNNAALNLDDQLFRLKEAIADAIRTQED